MDRTALIVEDDVLLHHALTDALADAGLQATAVSTGEAALAACTETNPAVVLLDLALPDMDGLDVCRNLRRESTVPIIMLTGRSKEMDHVVGLEVGADDFIAKPFRRSELVARVRALLRRVHDYSQDQPGNELTVGPLQLRKAQRTVSCRDKDVILTPKEFDLLWALTSRPGEVIPSKQLLWDVWQYPVEVRTRTLDVHIGRLRGKLELDRKRPDIIHTVSGVGYKVDPPAWPPAS